MLHGQLTNLIIGCYYKVYNELGYGFLEKVYEKAMLVEMRKQGLDCKVQEPIKVFYKGVRVGEYFADIIVSNLVIIEIKACEHIADAHETQLLNYLRATEMEIGVLLNFGKAPQFKRKIYSNPRKNNVSQDLK